MNMLQTQQNSALRQHTFRFSKAQAEKNIPHVHSNLQVNVDGTLLSFKNPVKSPFG